MTITHHLDDATLMSFTAGTLPAALAAVAAAHIDICPRCRRDVAMLERVGGALLSSLPAEALAAGPPPPPVGPRERRERAPVRSGEVPRPLAGLLLGGDLDDVPWRWIGPGVWDHRLPLVGAGRLRLIKAAPGRALPEHGHIGSEITLVLRGSFSDQAGRYLRGDVAEADEDQAHTPLNDAQDDCICLVGSEQPEQFTGLLARQWRRLRRF
jgi:putative transcriptional regulator